MYETFEWTRKIYIAGDQLSNKRLPLSIHWGLLCFRAHRVITVPTPGLPEGILYVLGIFRWLIAFDRLPLRSYRGADFCVSILTVSLSSKLFIRLSVGWPGLLLASSLLTGRSHIVSCVGHILIFLNSKLLPRDQHDLGSHFMQDLFQSLTRHRALRSTASKHGVAESRCVLRPGWGRKARDKSCEDFMEAKVELRRGTCVQRPVHSDLVQLSSHLLHQGRQDVRGWSGLRFLGVASRGRHIDAVRRLRLRQVVFATRIDIVWQEEILACAGERRDGSGVAVYVQPVSGLRAGQPALGRNRVLQFPGRLIQRLLASRGN